MIPASGGPDSELEHDVDVREGSGIRSSEGPSSTTDQVKPQQAQRKQVLEEDDNIHHLQSHVTDVLPESHTHAPTNETPSKVPNGHQDFNPPLEASSEDTTPYTRSVGSDSLLHTQQTTPVTPSAHDNLNGATANFVPHNTFSLDTDLSDLADLAPHPSQAPFYGQTFEGIFNGYPVPTFQPPSTSYIPTGHYYPNGNIVATFPQPPTLPPVASYQPPTMPDDPFSLIQHLLHNFNEALLSDVLLRIEYENEEFPTQKLYLHKILLAQSPRLKDLMTQESPATDENGRCMIDLLMTDSFLTASSLELCLKFCYGERNANLTGSSSYNSGTWAEEQSEIDMKESLGFAVAGHALQMPAAMMRGFTMAASVLDWSNIEYALSFASNNIDLKYYTSKVPAVPHTQRSLSDTIHGVEDPSVPLFADYARDFLFSIFHFMTYNVPSTFTFDESARLLSQAISKRSSPQHLPQSNTSLQNIQFGQRELTENDSSSDDDQLISSILLSLPFEVLASFLNYNRGCGGQVHSQMGQIVDERNRRRRLLQEAKKAKKAEESSAEHVHDDDANLFEYIEGNSDGTDFLAHGDGTNFLPRE